MISTLARRHPLRAILLGLLVVVLVDFGADTGCSCNDLTQRTVAVGSGYRGA